MKAICVHEFGDPEVMKLEEVTEPKPGPGEVLIKVHAVGVNPVDTYIRSGAYTTKPSLPYTPGTDAAGIVETIGEGVSRFKPGDRIYTIGTLNGTYSEKTLCQESQIRPLPPRVSFAQGAGVNTPYSAAFRALFQRARAVAGEVILINGASGGVGIAAVQFARAAGLTVIGTVGTKEARQMVYDQGAHYVFDHHSPDYLNKVIDLTHGNGVDIILEMLANVNLGKDLAVIASGGRVVVIGSRGVVEINPRELMVREAYILGMLLWNATDREIFSIHAAIIAGLENETLRPIIGREMPLADASKAHHFLIESASYGKIILIP